MGAWLTEKVGQKSRKVIKEIRYVHKRESWRRGTELGRREGTDKGKRKRREERERKRGREGKEEGGREAEQYSQFS